MVNNRVVLTHRGVATIAAVESGLLPETENGWDNAAFDMFWDRYLSNLENYRQNLPRKQRSLFDKQRD